MRIQVFQHVPFEGSAVIGRWASRHGHPIQETHLYIPSKLPTVDDFDWLVILGGPMGATDDTVYPWLTGEKHLIGEAIEAGKGVLGICLGAQLIASVQGAKVRRNDYQEIGWFPLTFTDEALGSPLFKGFPRSLEVMHWHGDTFALPEGCTRIAASEACLNQGFMSPDARVIGLQFHMEWDRPMTEILIRHGAADLQAGPYVQNALEILAPEDRFMAMNQWMFQLLDAFQRLNPSPKP